METVDTYTKKCVDCKFRSLQRMQMARNTKTLPHDESCKNRLPRLITSLITYTTESCRRCFHLPIKKCRSSNSESQTDENCMEHTESPHKTYFNTKCIRWFCNFSEHSNLWRTILRQTHHRNTLHGEPPLSKIQWIISLRNRQKKTNSARICRIRLDRASRTALACHSHATTMADCHVRGSYKTQKQVEGMIIVKNALDKEK